MAISANNATAIGIMGGTFDPVHYGHLRAALEVTELFELAELRLIPCARPSHRNQPQTPANMRADMLALAIKRYSNLKLDTREIHRPGKSYTVDTLVSLREELPEHPLLLFIGSDAFNQLASWYQWQRLFDYAHIIVLARPSTELPTLNSFCQQRLVQQRTELNQHLAGLLYLQTITQLDISATAIRQLIAQGKNPGFLLPDAVIEYIHQHQLYQSQ